MTTFDEALAAAQAALDRALAIVPSRPSVEAAEGVRRLRVSVEQLHERIGGQNESQRPRLIARSCMLWRLPDAVVTHALSCLDGRALAAVERVSHAFEGRTGFARCATIKAATALDARSWLLEGASIARSLQSVHDRAARIRATVTRAADGDDDEKEEAVRELYDLSHDGYLNSNTVKVAIALGAVAPLVNLVVEGDVAHFLTQWALATLANFTFSVSSCANSIVELGVLQPLMAILENGRGQIVTDAFALLRDLSCSPSLRTPIAEAGTIGRLVPLLELELETPTAAGLVELLDLRITQRHAGRLQDAVDAISTCMMNHPANKQRAEEAGARPILERLLADEATENFLRLKCALACIPWMDDLDCVLLARVGARLFHFMTSPRFPEETRSYTRAALRTLADDAEARPFVEQAVGLSESALDAALAE